MLFLTLMSFAILTVRYGVSIVLADIILGHHVIALCLHSRFFCVFLRLVLLSRFLESLNSWILCRRLYVAAMMGNSTMTGVTIPFHEVGSDVAVTDDRCLKPGTRSSSSSALSSSTSSACATPLRRRGAASSSCLSPGPVTSSSSKSTFVLSPSTSGGSSQSGKGSVRGHSHSLQILRVDLKECRALSSKKRVPYLLVFEVADLDEVSKGGSKQRTTC